MEMNRNKFIKEIKKAKRIKKLFEAIEKVSDKALEYNETKFNLILLEKLMKYTFDYKHILTEGSEDIPEQYTGINVLKDLLKRVIPVIEKDYKKLTTNQAQRESYKAHILNAIVNVITDENFNNHITLPKDFDERVKNSPKLQKELMLKEKVEVNVNSDDDDFELDDDKYKNLVDAKDIDIDPDNLDVNKDKFIDIDPLQKRKELKNIEDKEVKQLMLFSLNNHEVTGRNIAFNSFKKISKMIIEDYNLLANEVDQEIFYNYLIANIKLYFDKFEEELSTIIKEPTNAEYETAKQQRDQKTSNFEDEFEENEFEENNLEGNEDFSDEGISEVEEEELEELKPPK